MVVCEMQRRSPIFPTRILVPGVIFSMASCGSLVGPNIQNSDPSEQTLDAGEATVQLARVGFRATALAAIRKRLTSARQGIAVFYHRPREIVAGNIPLDLIPDQETAFAPGTREFEKLLDEQGFPKASFGRLKWLVDGPNFSETRQADRRRTAVDSRAILHHR